MKKLTITIELDNSAFDGNYLGKEIAHILERETDYMKRISRQDLIKTFVSGQPLFDHNGNKVGKIQID